MKMLVIFYLLDEKIHKHLMRGGLFKLRFIADHKYSLSDKMNVWWLSIP